ncbi:IS5 family transposase [Lentibacillus salicampi]|uniref:IS5 family transposase n=1 Tax=Lentibacillus salicampi TaxID=175306 RepID=A0A4Y9AAL1_9BACI|nr:IS5 family transposase [Lentibacillus salicampi]TFJ91371.1 IS5 family transposase [Lentibacillus salicampi]
MYNHSERQIMLPGDFFLPFGGELNPKNRWVVLANLIPWWKAEERYKKQLKDLNQGAQANSIRLALGSIIVKERLGTSDAETVEQIMENPYLQYFIGLPEFQYEAPFHASSMTHFRKRIPQEMVNQVNEWIVEEQQVNNDQDDEDSSGGGSDDSLDETTNNQKKDRDAPRHHQGKLLMDATCAPADITYPTDLKLLNEGREKLESMIDVLHAPFCGLQEKPRTYRKKARKDYLALAKQKKPSRRKLRKGIKKQLNYVKRDLNYLQTLVKQGGLERLNSKQYRDLFVIQELYRQQKQMFMTKIHRIDDRIVSISQPHVRPIVRGKTHTNVEFGAKLSLSLVDGWAFLDNLSWDAYHEGGDLPASVERYLSRNGCYPEAVLADQIYLTRDNRRYCKERGIRLSGPKLGRPPKNEDKEQKRIAYQDASERNAMEGKFGEAKRIYGLGLIQARLQQTSESVIALQVLNLNLSRALRELSFLFFSFRWPIHSRIEKMTF